MDVNRTDLFLVKGVSMVPVLRTGDKVELRAVERSALRCGDILVFTTMGGREIIHRVIRVSPLQTRGDNCCRDDQPVPADSPLFLALSFCRNGREHNLSSGAAGMREFRRNQFRSQLVSGLRKTLSPVLQHNPLKIPFKKLTRVTFSEKVVYYAGKRSVGWTDEKGWHWMRYARYFVEGPPEGPHE